MLMCGCLPDICFNVIASGPIHFIFRFYSHSHHDILKVLDYMIFSLPSFTLVKFRDLWRWFRNIWLMYPVQDAQNSNAMTFAGDSPRTPAPNQPREDSISVPISSNVIHLLKYEGKFQINPRCTTWILTSLQLVSLAHAETTPNRVIARVQGSHLPGNSRYSASTWLHASWDTASMGVDWNIKHTWMGMSQPGPNR